MVEFAEKLGKTIKIERIRRDMNQAELAFQANINQSHLSKIENGSVNVSVIMLKRIADVFDCRICDLLVDVDKN
ncbi:helix-turn-helix domain-containing protein [Thalassotalea mangrovi]|uniref:Helix-turn-helix transcriptional regulator n=1 Tax=Thalassotalea mangrovi TaxID=2572245 RepID=A0A4U1B2H4_9GAMM|nr:helix-turn-helix transcriptional regulator [Thalassotalea mangrovi]TKB43027.1 helix-turn-helix transcriptional regulator [Thalassotalea mangrovi]